MESRLTQKAHMTEPTPQARIVLTTAASHDEAARLASALVEERLAACATLIPAVESIYRWEGQVESSTETLLLLKTGPDQLAALEARLRELHSYQVPEFLVLNVESGSHPYLEWLHASLKKTEHPPAKSNSKPELTS
jgi:periplasmic divalent cation tolerance protein